MAKNDRVPRLQCTRNLKASRRNLIKGGPTMHTKKWNCAKIQSYVAIIFRRQTVQQTIYWYTTVLGNKIKLKPRMADFLLFVFWCLHTLRVNANIQ